LGIPRKLKTNKQKDKDGILNRVAVL